MFEKLESGFVGFAANFLSSLAPCARTMVARSRQKNLRSRLAKFQFFKHFRYIALFILLMLPLRLFSLELSCPYELCDNPEENSQYSIINKKLRQLFRKM